MAVREKGNSYQTDIMVRGVRHRACFATRHEAEQWERDIKHAAASGRDIPPAKTKRTHTGGELRTLYQLFQHVDKTHWSRMSGCAGVLSNARSIVATIGPNFPVVDIDKAVLQEAASKLLDEGNTVATVNRKLAAISKMLTEAHDLGVIDKKPKIPKGKEMNVEVRFLTVEEEERLVTAFEQLGLDHWVPFVRFAIDTGLRLGEVLSLRWGHIHNGTVTVWKTKANKPRTIPLTKRALLALEAMQERHSHAAGPFTPWKNNTTLKRSMRLQWDAGMKAAGLDRRIHDLRHTCASRLVQRGVDLLRVKDYLGHSNVATTLRYAHLAPTNLEACRDVLDRDNPRDKVTA